MKAFCVVHVNSFPQVADVDSKAATCQGSRSLVDAHLKSSERRNQVRFKHGLVVETEMSHAVVLGK